MDKYHIYEEIGKGECSQVFKGREKKRIEYVAIKRVDKSNMTQVVNEVQIMHKLQNPHILRFHDWYETKNNLWLILEYCTGADLQSLLAQDNHLPEASLKIFGIDILSGLKYMHSLGILHCDIRPKNFLIDEHGIVKFSNFKYARRIPKMSLGEEPLSTRGFPAVMAPELFSAEGCHSYASDFWAFGCILYVFRRGSLPWALDNASESTIQQKITAMSLFDFQLDSLPQSVSAANLPSMSAELADLISWLVERTSYHRCSWKELCQHPFWGENSIHPPENLPPNAAFENFVKHRIQIQRELSEKAIAEEILQQKSTYLPVVGPAARVSPHRPGVGIVGANVVAVNHDDSSTKSHAKPFQEELGKRNGFSEPMATSDATGSSFPAIGLVSDASTKYKADNLIIHASDTQVKPIIGNKAIEVIDKFSFKSGLPITPISLEDADRLSQSELELHLTSVYKAIYRYMSNLWTPSTLSISPSNTSVNTVGALNNLLAYLGTVCISSEVANVVLNTGFLYLLLRIMRSTIMSTLSNSVAHSKSSRYGSPSSNTATSRAYLIAVNEGLMVAKVSIATILGTMLRYATFVVPPSGKNRDEHIVSVLVEIIVANESQRADVKLRRRCIAALGEILFYITAQDDSDESYRVDNKAAETSVAEREKWNLPLDVIQDLLLRSLRDDDEVVRHYAVKTLENIIAQGHSELREVLLGANVATALIEAYYSSQSDGIQVTYIMSLSLILYRVYCANYISFTRLAAQVLHGTFINAITSNLDDSATRLQIAFVNIIGLVFIHTSYGDVLTDKSALRSARMIIIGQPAIIATLGRFVEMANLAPLRAKSLICLQLICRYSPQLLRKLCEQRFASTLSRLLESANNNNAQIRPNSGDQQASAYLVDATLSTVVFLRTCAVSTLSDIEATIVEIRRDALSSVQFDINHYSSDRSEIAKLENLSTILSSILSLSSFSALRRFFFSSESVGIVVSLVRTIQELQNLLREHPQVTEYTEVVNRALLLTLETIAKIDFTERVEGLDNMKRESIKVEVYFIHVVSSLIYPLLLTFSENEDPDSRMVAISCIRTMLPSLIKSYLLIESKHLGDATKSTSPQIEVNRLIDSFLYIVPALLRGFSPIPQYTIRLLNDLLEMAPITAMIERFTDNLPGDLAAVIREANANQQV